NDIPELKNHVTAELIGIPLPFPGVDGSSIRDKVFSESGDPASWPLKAGIKYTYKDSFPIHSIYPTTQVLVHWALKDAGRDIVCFEVLARIQ
ncbi:Niemann-pick type C-2b, partial [Operophtera brumata]